MSADLLYNIMEKIILKHFQEYYNEVVKQTYVRQTSVDQRQDPQIAVAAAMLTLAGINYQSAMYGGKSVHNN